MTTAFYVSPGYAPYYYDTAPAVNSILTPINLTGTWPIPTLNQNQTVYQGTDWLFQINVTNSGTITPTDLTSCTVEWVMQPNLSSPSPTLKLDTTTGITVTDATGGILQISVSHTQTISSSIPQGTYQHWCIVTDATGKREAVTIGRLTVNGLPS